MVLQARISGGKAFQMSGSTYLIDLWAKALHGVNKWKSEECLVG